MSLHLTQNHAGSRPDQLEDGLWAQDPVGTLHGLSACLKRPLIASDLELLADIIEVFRDFPGSVIGAQTPARVLKGNHPIGKKLALYGKYQASPVATPRLTEIGCQVYHALLKSGAYRFQGEGHGPDHTFRPATCNAAIATAFIGFVKSLSALPEVQALPSVSPPKIKVAGVKEDPSIALLKAAGMAAVQKTAAETYLDLRKNLYSHPLAYLNEEHEKRKSQEYSFVALDKPWGRIKSEATANGLVITSYIGDVAIGWRHSWSSGQSARPVYSPVLRTTIDADGAVVQWEAGWRWAVESNRFRRDEKLEEKIMAALPQLAAKRCAAEMPSPDRPSPPSPRNNSDFNP